MTIRPYRSSSDVRGLCLYMRTNSDLELDTNFHDLRARNVEIGAGPLRVVVHERKQHFAPSRHARPPAGRDYRFVAGVVDHPREIALRDLPTQGSDFKPFGNVGLLHEAKAQLDACDVV